MKCNETALNACKFMLDYHEALKECKNDPKMMSSFCTAKGETLDIMYYKMITEARRAIEEESNP